MSLPRPCCLNPLVIPGSPRGELAYFDASEKQVKWYLAKPAHVKREDTALVLFYDVFGFNLPNAKILADKFADDLGVNVYVPNYLPSAPLIEPFEPILELYPGQLGAGVLSSLKVKLLTVYAFLSSLPRLISVLDWFAYPKALSAIDEIKNLHPRLGTVGYCRGGAIVVRLMSERTPSITSGMICHPGPIKMREWDTIDKPTKWHLAAVDDFMKKDQIDRLELLKTQGESSGKSLDYKVHRETTHGFASRPNTDHPPSKAAFDEVNADVVSFFSKIWRDV